MKPPNAPPPGPSPTPVPVRVWDLPTRLFHWTLATCVVFSVVTARVGGGAVEWHFRSGYVIFTLLAFRLLWGFVGGRWSRFASFVYAPSTLWRYLSGRAAPHEHLDVGHSPLGALSVFALLAVLAVQVGTGLVADDEIANVGPLNRYVTGATGLAATAWHKGWGQWLIVGLVLVHVTAIVVYTLRGRSLVPAMVGGDKALAHGTPASDDGARVRLRALLLIVVCGAAVAALVTLVA
jgi:cytochrome b